MKPEIKKVPIFSSISKLFAERRMYVLGTLVGLILIGVNFYVGIFLINTISKEHTLAVEEGLSLPVIHKDKYEKIKEEYLHRKEKDLKKDFRADPFY